MSPLVRKPELPPKPEEYRVNLGLKRFYLNDIDSIVRLMRSKSATVEILAGKAVADEAADLREASPEELKSIHIRSKNPDCVVLLWRARAEAYTNDPDGAGRDVVDSVLSLLPSFSLIPFLRRAWTESWKRIAAMGVAAGLLALVAQGMNDLSRHSSVKGSTLTWGILGLWALLSIVSICTFLVSEIFSTTGAYVLPRLRSEGRAFATDSKQKAAIAIGSAIVGGVITFLVAYWRYSKGS